MHSIAKNTTFFTGALILQKIMAFVYFGFLARALAPEDLGKYTFALSFAAMFGIIVDLGLVQMALREMAKHRERAGEYISNIIWMKIPLGAIAWMSIFFLINALGYPPLTRNMVYIAGLVMVLDSFCLTFYSIYRSRQNLIYESIGTILFQIVLVGSGLAVIFTNKSLLLLVAAVLASSLFNFIYSFILLNRAADLKLMKWDLPVIKKMLKLVLPFLGIGALIKIYASVDTVMLSLLDGDAAVGYYSIPFKITFVMPLIAGAFIASVYPAMSAAHENKERLKSLFEQSMRYLIILSVPAAFGISMLARRVITAVWPEYEPSILALQILIWAVIFVFLEHPLGSLLNASNKERTNMKNRAVHVSAAIILNLILIPRLSFIGTAIGAVISNGILFILGLYWAGKIVNYDKLKIFMYAFRSALAALAMSAFIWYFMDWNILLLIFLSFIIYFVALFLVRGITKNDLKKIYSSMAQK